MRPYTFEKDSPTVDFEIIHGCRFGGSPRHLLCITWLARARKHWDHDMWNSLIQTLNSWGRSCVRSSKNWRDIYIESWSDRSTRSIDSLRTNYDQKCRHTGVDARSRVELSTVALLLQNCEVLRMGEKVRIKPFIHRSLPT